ncbi:MAG: hypothetical protein AAF192_01215 [Pseudomonadota bacterium]
MPRNERPPATLTRVDCAAGATALRIAAACHHERIGGRASAEALWRVATALEEAPSIVVETPKPEDPMTDHRENLPPIYLVFADRGDGGGMLFAGQEATKEDALRMAHRLAGPRNFIVHEARPVIYRLDMPDAPAQDAGRAEARNENGVEQ